MSTPRISTEGTDLESCRRVFESLLYSGFKGKSNSIIFDSPTGERWFSNNCFVLKALLDL